MNINSKLVTFSQDLVLVKSDTEKQGILNSLEHLEKVLRDKLGSEIKEIIRFGSFTRNTILPRKYDPKSDVDLMVVFNTNSQVYKPETYRTKLLDVVQNAYPNSISQKDFPAVKLELNHIMFDIVPAYCQSLMAFKSYYIPDKNYGWHQTSPNDINQPLIDANQRYGQNTVRNVIRLCKYWNASNRYPFESYLLEKQLISLGYYGHDTYSGFITAMSSVSYYQSGVSQSLDYIRRYKNSYPPDEEKQLEWLKRLLPELK